MLLTRISDLTSVTFHMPPLATTVLNQEAINLVSEWITNGLATYQNFSDWQLAFFNSTNADAAAPDADPDGDGANNQLEYLLGGDPLRPGDAWSISIQSSGSSIHIQFPRLANRAFEVQWTGNLQDGKSWVALDNPGNRPFFSSTNGQAVVEDPNSSASSRFYRVRVFTP